ncbi:MFS transporter [Amnibacterium setariae]|uniref:DHA2 family efflux MFS transporter permease subunit n=1 Tax=Amnibacterium setariae TaxID=2306585 RepID=A0A3A1U179_9MICO|nr:MFS transporter [Amnibacterium setariae]RIX28206.1 DHA2 family efflux MFS transporter permease subunit [Amnibacterium setariae]
MTDEPPARQRHPKLILAICCLSLFIVTLDATVTNVALPTIGKELHAGVTSLQWTLDAYTLTLAALLVLAGSSADRFGRKRVFRIGLVVFGLGSLACSAAPSDGALIAARVLQALGGTMLNPVSLSIITNAFQDRKARAGALGVWGAISGVSLGFGPLVGGLLVETVGWRAIFWVNVPVVVAALVLTTLFVPESRAPRRRRFDPVGQVLVVVLLAGTVFGIIEGPELGWASPATLGAFAVSAVALALFVPAELRRQEPLIDPRFFTSIPFSGAVVAAVLAFGSWSAFLFSNTLLLQDVKGFSPILTGLLFMPAGIAILVASPVSGRLVGSLGTRLPMSLAGLLIAAAAVALALTTSSAPVALLAVVFAVFGLGFGLVNAPITNTAVSGMPNDQAGAASAIASTGRQVGTSLGIALAGSITGASGAGGRVPRSFATDAHPLWWTVAGAALAIVAIGSLSSSKAAERSSERLGELVGGRSAV